MKQNIVFLLLLVAFLAAPAPVLAQQNATDDLIKTLQSRVKRYPEDHAGYAALGAAYLQKGTNWPRTRSRSRSIWFPTILQPRLLPRKWRFSAWWSTVLKTRSLGRKRLWR